MAKQIAVVVRDRQGEALRMAIGLTLNDDAIDLFVLDRKVEETEANTLNLDSMDMMDIKGFTNAAENENMECLSTEELAKKLLEYDSVLPY